MTDALWSNTDLLNDKKKKTYCLFKLVTFSILGLSCNVIVLYLVEVVANLLKIRK